MRSHIRTVLFAAGAVAATCLPCHARWSIDLETGIASPGYNDVRVPRDTGTLFSLTDDLSADTARFLRLRLGYAAGSRDRFWLLAAPLELTSAGSFDRPVLFDGTVFPAGVPVTARYRFDSWRLGWQRTFLRAPGWEAGAGLTAKIRDAAISLKSPGAGAEKTNTGFVPLINFRVQWEPGGPFSALLEGDALAAPQGRAEDVLAAVLYTPAPALRLKAGYRVLEGGADNDEVYNFALVHYLVIGGELSF